MLYSSSSVASNAMKSAPAIGTGTTPSINTAVSAKSTGFNTPFANPNASQGCFFDVVNQLHSQPPHPNQMVGSAVMTPRSRAKLKSNFVPMERIPSLASLTDFSTTRVSAAATCAAPASDITSAATASDTLPSLVAESNHEFNPLWPYNPVANENAVIQFAETTRFTILTPHVIRMEWSPDGNFDDRASFFACNRRTDVPQFLCTTDENVLKITTESLVLTYTGAGNNFSADNLMVSFTCNGVNKTWHYGQENVGQLGGTVRTLDGIRGGTELRAHLQSDSQQHCTDGVISREGWVVIDDSQRPLFDGDTRWPWVATRTSEVTRDLYFFGHGHNYKKALTDFVLLGGRIPIPPRYVFGIFYSRYWAYNQRTAKQIVEEYEQYALPLDVMVIDMDWHHTFYRESNRGEKDIAGQPLGWSGFTWDKNLFPDPKSFLNWCHQRGLRVTLNLHPASGILPHEYCFCSMHRALTTQPDPTTTGIPALPVSPTHVPYDMQNRRFASALMEHALKPIEQQGVDFWWLDWQQGEKWTTVPGVNPTFWLNHCFITNPLRWRYNKDEHSSLNANMNSCNISSSSNPTSSPIPIPGASGHNSPTGNSTSNVGLSTSYSSTSSCSTTRSYKPHNGSPASSAFFPSATLISTAANVCNALGVPSSVLLEEYLNTQRPVILHRWGGLGNHRYQIGFSGDVVPAWESLEFQPYFTATSANVGYAYWSHDLGGHTEVCSPELYLRWLQWGALSPIFRTHCCKDPENDRRIYTYPFHYFTMMRQAVLLRESLVPYIYTASRRAFDTGLSPLHPLYYDYPDFEEAYTFTNEYSFGQEIIASPVVKACNPMTTLSPASVWIPPGEWLCMTTGTTFTGPQVLPENVSQYALHEIPIFMKSGAVVPLLTNEDVTKTGAASKIPNRLFLAAFPSSQAGSTYESSLYDDDGSSLAYQLGHGIFTRYRLSTISDTSVNLEILPAQGSFNGMIKKRSYTIQLLNVLPALSVSVDGQPISNSSDPQILTRYTYKPETLSVEITLAAKSIRPTKPRLIEVHWKNTISQMRTLVYRVRGHIARTIQLVDMFDHNYPHLTQQDYPTLIRAATLSEILATHPSRAEQYLSEYRHLLKIAKDEIEAIDPTNLPAKLRETALAWLTLN